MLHDVISNPTKKEMKEQYKESIEISSNIIKDIINEAKAWGN